MIGLRPTSKVSTKWPKMYISPQSHMIGHCSVLKKESRWNWWSLFTVFLFQRLLRHYRLRAQSEWLSSAPRTRWPGLYVKKARRDVAARRLGITGNYVYDAMNVGMPEFESFTKTTLRSFENNRARATWFPSKARNLTPIVKARLRSTRDTMHRGSLQYQQTLHLTTSAEPLHCFHDWNILAQVKIVR